MQPNGFTIIELIITIFILSIGVIGVYSAFSAMIVFTQNASDQLQAAYLAQEGIEIIRNIRDTNWIKGNDWMAGLSDCIETGSCEFEVDFTTTGETTHPIDMSTGDYLLKDSSGFYGYPIVGGEETKFQRKIIVTPVTGQEDYAMDVFIEVSWNKKKDLVSDGELADTCSTQNCVRVEERLYDWY